VSFVCGMWGRGIEEVEEDEGIFRELFGIWRTFLGT
jgi:hypothetical protein